MLATFTVSSTADSGTGSLREAISMANAATGADEVVFLSSLLGQTINLTSGQLTIDDDLTVTGFNGNPVRIDAGGNSRIFNINDQTPSFLDVTLRDLHLTGGNPGGNISGGAIGSSENLTIERCIISDNTGTSAGGAIRQFDGRLALYDSALSNNETDRFGGGAIRFTGTNMVVARSTISDNTVGTLGTFSGQHGGGISFDSTGYLTIADSLITGNSSRADGGGIYARNAGYAGIYNTTVSDNSAVGSSADGGGLSFVDTGFAGVRFSTVSGNSATKDGGGIRMVRAGAGEITASTISGNSAGRHGGGFRPYDSNIPVRHSTIVLNTADADSDGSGLGGGIQVGGSSVLTLENSIVATNQDLGHGPDIDATTATALASFSLVGDNTGSGLAEAQLPDGSGNLIGSVVGAGEIDPLLEPIGDYGGATPTHVLRAGSPAINAGDPAISSLTSDQRIVAPFARVQQGRIDMGATEYAPNLLTVDRSSDELDLDLSPGDLSLREAIELANGNPDSTTIQFAVGTTVNLTMGELLIRQSLDINGPATPMIIDGQASGRVFQIDDGQSGDIDVTLSRLHIRNGNDTGGFGGGGILNRENLTLEDSILSGNSTTVWGGGIRSTGPLTLDNTSVLGNFASNDGGGIMFLDFGSDALRLIDSAVSQNTTLRDGGGISSQGYMAIYDSTIAQNSAALDGGGISGVGYSTTIENAEIADNSAGSQGGGVYWLFGDVQLRDSIVNGNSSTSRGGGFYHYGSDYALDVVRSTISGNSSANRGGGIYAYLSYFNLDDSTVASNSSASDGGGIGLCDVPYASIVDSTVSQNIAGDDGAGVFLDLTSATITRSTIASNRGTGPNSAGGGVFSYGRSADVADTTINYNSSHVGGGIYIDNGFADIVNSTISGNSADADGGGIHGSDGSTVTMLLATVTANRAGTAGTGGTGGGAFAGTATRLELDHTIVADNLEGSLGGTLNDLANSTGFFPAEFSVIGVDSSANIQNNGNNLIGSVGSPVDSLLGPLADNGGPVRTHALLLGSPAIDRGDSTLVAGSGGIPMMDPRGGPFVRISNGEGNGTNQIDIGAYEVLFATPQTFVVNVPDDEFDFSPTSGDMSLREALELSNHGNHFEDTIEFAPGLGTIVLTRGELEVKAGVTIDGPGADSLAIDAQGGSRVFRVNDDVYYDRVQVAINGLTITGGVADNGGGILNEEELTINDSVIANNIANGPYAKGGGVFNGYDAWLTLQRTTITGNSSSRDGGGLATGVGLFRLRDSTVVGNYATNRGGGLDVGSSYPHTPSISNSTISGNVAGQGGGLANRGLLSIWHSTITANESTGGTGGGVSTAGLSYVNTRVVSSIISANLGGDVDFVTVNAFESQGHNVVGDGNATGSFNTSGDQTGVTNPGLEPLADNGGPTQTHALLSFSPALDAGDPNAVAGSAGVPLTDQRGLARISDSDNDGTARIDVGAYELQSALPDPDFNDDGNLDGLDIDLLVANIALGPPDPATFDLTGDGDVDVADRDLWLALAGAANLPSGNPYLLGDANLDGSVNGLDFVAWNDNKFTNVAAWTKGDFNADGFVNGQDFVIWNDHKFQTADVHLWGRVHDEALAQEPEAPSGERWGSGLGFAFDLAQDPEAPSDKRWGSGQGLAFELAQQPYLPIGERWG